MSKGSVAGITMGVLIGLVIALAVVYIVYKHRNRWVLTVNVCTLKLFEIILKLFLK